MDSVINAVTAFIAANPQLAYGAVFLFALSESLPVVGALFPGSALIIAISLLVPGGTLSLVPLIASAVAGAVVSDGFSFWLGYRYHRDILNHWPLNRKSAFIGRSEAFFKRHGNMSVFIARFTPGVRAIVPLLAGVMLMPPARFYAANILSALVWAPSHILPSALLGYSLMSLGKRAEPVAILGVALILIGWVIYRAVQHVRTKGHGTP